MPILGFDWLAFAMEWYPTLIPSEHKHISGHNTSKSKQDLGYNVIDIETIMDIIRFS